MRFKKLLYFTALSLLIISCSDDSSVSPEIEVVWTGLTSQNLPVSITVKNISGIQKVIAFSLQYQYSYSGGNYSGTSSKTDSEGLTDVTDNTFTIAMDTTNGGLIISGTFSNNILNGTFSVSVLPLSSEPGPVTGTFTAHQ